MLPIWRMALDRGMRVLAYNGDTDPGLCLYHTQELGCLQVSSPPPPIQSTYLVELLNSFSWRTVRVAALIDRDRHQQFHHTRQVFHLP